MKRNSVPWLCSSWITTIPAVAIRFRSCASTRDVSTIGREGTVKRLFLVLFIAAFMTASAAAQQIKVTFQWDASATQSTPENPIKYRLCWMPAMPPTDGTYPETRTINEAGDSLVYDATMGTGTFYVFATAFYYGMRVDAVLDATRLLESGPSNVIKIEIFAPPGNPSKIRIKGATAVAFNGGAGPSGLRAELKAK